MRALLRSRKAVVGLAMLAVLVVIAVIGPWIASEPTEMVAQPHLPPSADHWFGTTGQGQDVLAQTLAGARITLLVGVIVGLAVLVIAASVALTAAYAGGWVDDVLSLFTNVFLLLPGLPLAVVLSVYLTPGPTTIAIVLIITGWGWHARVLRAQALVVRQREYVQAAIVIGESRLRIVLVEMLPNLTPVLASSFIGATTYAVGAQVGLEFLGLGDPSVLSWGNNLYMAGNDQALLTGAWWLFVPAGIGVALISFALVLINFAIDEIADPRLRGTGREVGVVAATVVRRRRAA